MTIRVALMVMFCFPSISMEFFHRTDGIDSDYEMRPSELLGEGKFGTVIGGINKKTGEEVAVKIIRVTPETYLCNNREILILRYLTAIRAHPHIVKFIDSFYYEEREHTGKIYLVMERIIGEDLIDYIDRTSLKTEEIMDVTAQIISVLRYLKMLGIAHRDLKLENIKITTDQEGKHRVVVLDFGMAKFFNAQRTRRSTTCCSVHYAPPELLCPGTIDDLSKRDAFALGVILYVLIKNELPWLSTRDFGSREFYLEISEKIVRLDYRGLDIVKGDENHNVLVRLTHALLSYQSDRLDPTKFYPELFKQQEDATMNYPREITQLNLLALQFIFNYIELNEMQVNARLSFENILDNKADFVTIFYHFLASNYPESPLVAIDELVNRASEASKTIFEIVQSDIKRLLNHKT